MTNIAELLQASTEPGNPPKKEGLRISFRGDAVMAVREILSLRSKNGLHTKLIFRGDTYEHHCVETEMTYEKVLELIGWI